MLQSHPAFVTIVGSILFFSSGLLLCWYAAVAWRRSVAAGAVVAQGGRIEIPRRIGGKLWHGQELVDQEEVVQGESAEARRTIRGGLERAKPSSHREEHHIRVHL